MKLKRWTDWITIACALWIGLVLGCLAWSWLHHFVRWSTPYLPWP